MVKMKRKITIAISAMRLLLSAMRFLLSVKRLLGGCKIEFLRLDDLTKQKNYKNGCVYTVKLSLREALKNKHPASRNFSNE